MEFDLDQVDRLLSTTRSVRRRLDLERPVPDHLLLRCIDLAEQAPSGGNQTHRRWLVIRDPATKARLADLYREVGVPFLQGVAALSEGTKGTDRRVFGSALYLAENLERAPVLVVVTIQGVHDGSGRPGLYDSVLQAAWSFCLAARARGLGTAWTTLHLNRAAETAALLGIPDGVTQVVLLPVAWTIGGEFHPVARRPAVEVTYFDQWAFTRARPSADGRFRLSDGPGVTVETAIAAPPERVWQVITGAHGDGVLGAEWEGIGPGKAEVYSTTTPGSEWAMTWSSGEHDGRTVAWRFTAEPALLPGPPPQRGTFLVYAATVGPGREDTADDDNDWHVITQQQRALRDSMRLTLRAIQELAELPRTPS
jgi:nitroreductase